MRARPAAITLLAADLDRWREGAVGGGTAPNVKNGWSAWSA